MLKYMKLALLFSAALLTAAGCSTYQGGTETPYKTTYGTAAEIPSPSGLDRAMNKNAFEYVPPLPYTSTNTTPEVHPQY